ncbi:hypothetical protein LJC56_09125 [Christensenellaceae bacterium OttesenSCG-928-K19]|nr:hypothetical protein [Christensenellaceae bacterium OttesenSCG-928-K19]
MLVNDITIVEISPCLADETKFKAITMTDNDLTDILPYMNTALENPNYQANSQSLVFKEGIVGFTLKGNQINITRFVNKTELLELLDWVKELVNAIDESKDSITPNYKSKTIVPTLTIYNMLPKTNCKECGESTCMAFAAKLNKFDAEIGDCPQLLKTENTALKEKLEKAFE